MIYSKELRKGNYVRGVNDNYVDRPNKLGENIFEVVLIGKDTVKVDIGFDAVQSYKEEDLEPILLTEEWLLKFGGEKVVLGFKFKGVRKTGRWIVFESFTNDKRLEKPFLRFDGLVDIYYIHQLQNLYFALTEKELEIKN